MPLSQTPEVTKLIEEDEFVGQVAGLSMKTILAACTALESLTDDIQKGMNNLKEKALVEYEELLARLDKPGMNWVEFAQFIRDQQARSISPSDKECANENAAMRAVARVFEEEQLKVVARQALELEEAWEDSCVQPTRSYSPAPDSILAGQETVSRKRPRRTHDPLETPTSLNGGPRLSVKMTPKLASCAKRFAEELSTMRRVDSRRLTQTGFVLLSADPSTKKSIHSNSFRLSSVLGATASRQEAEPLKDHSVESRQRGRYTFGQNAVTDEEWQEAHEEMSCASSGAGSCLREHTEEDCPVPIMGEEGVSSRDSGVEVALDDDMQDDHGDTSLTEESSGSATEGEDGTEEEEEEDDEEENEDAGLPAEERGPLSEPKICGPRPDEFHAMKDTSASQGFAVGLNAPTRKPEAIVDQECTMSDGDHVKSGTMNEEGRSPGEDSDLDSAESESIGEMSDEDEEQEELSPTSSCDSSEEGRVSEACGSESAARKPPVVERSPMSGFVPSAVGALLKTPLVRIQEKLGAFGRSKIPHSEEVVSITRRPDLDRKLHTADAMPSDSEANLNRSTIKKSIPSGGTSVVDAPATAERTTRSYHRFLKPLGPKNPTYSADITGIDQGLEKRMWVEAAGWARGDMWQKEVKRQAKWNPYSLFGYGVKAAQFSDVFQTPDFRRATSNVRYNMLERTDGRISRMNRWEVDKVACAFNESEGMTQEQLQKMIQLLNKTEDISDLAYEQVWIRCTPDCSHDAGKKQPWHREELVVGQR